jgi:hypothetical protein
MFIAPTSTHCHDRLWPGQPSQNGDAVRYVVDAMEVATMIRSRLTIAGGYLNR